MTRLVRWACPALLVALIAACGDSKVTDPLAIARRSTGPAASPTAARTRSGSTLSPAPSAMPSTSTVTPAPSGTGPSTVALPWTPDPNVPVDAQVSPLCVTRGTLVRLTVQTRPKAGIAWQAVYSDGAGGAPKPYGGGYGGNDKGFSDGQGRYTSSWVVSPTAPSGPGRVDVIVGWNETWGYDGPTFAVAGSDGNC